MRAKGSYMCRGASKSSFAGVARCWPPSWGREGSLGQGRASTTYLAYCRPSRPPSSQRLWIFHGAASIEPAGQPGKPSYGEFRYGMPAYRALVNLAAFSDVLRNATRIVRSRHIVRITPRIGRPEAAKLLNGDAVDAGCSLVAHHGPQRRFYVVTWNE
jgi:hypothetical protein